MDHQHSVPVAGKRSSHCQSIRRSSRCGGLAGRIHSLQAVGIPGMAWPPGSCTTHKESSISRWDDERKRGVPLGGNEDHFQPLVKELI